MEKFLTLMEYYWISNGTLPKILLVFWVIAVIGFYAVVIYGISSSLFNYFKSKLNGKFS
jgi:hypothetical protein